MTNEHQVCVVYDSIFRQGKKCGGGAHTCVDQSVIVQGPSVRQWKEPQRHLMVRFKKYE